MNETADPKKFKLFSLSGNAGNKPFIARIDFFSFELEKRKYQRNDFSPIFFGQFTPEGNGTRIHGHFDSSSWARGFMKLWLSIVVVFFVAVAGPVLLGIIRKGKGISGDDWLWVFVPCVMVAWGILLPKLGRWLARGQERAILEFLQSTFMARPTISMLPIEPE